MAGGKLISTGVEFPDATTQTSATNTSASTTELDILDGATLTTTEINYVDGVTSDIQTQINSKQATIADNGLSGDKIDGGTISNFTSTGIDDNATSTAITIDASENVILTSDLIVKGTVTSDIFQQDTGTVDAVFKMKVNANNWSVQSSNDSYGFVADIFQIDGTAPEATLQLKASGDARLSTGNLVIGTSGKGIDFSAATPDGTGSTGSEVLDDYEEGTWTPTLSGASTAGTWVAGTSTGNYTKIGNLVTIQTYISGASLSGAAGNLTLNGLPFSAISGDPGALGSAIARYANINVGATCLTLSAVQINNAATMTFRESGDALATNTILYATAVTTMIGIVFTQTYRTA